MSEVEQNGVATILRIQPPHPIRSGSLIRVQWTIRNQLSEPINFQFNSGQQYDFQVEDQQGRNLWKWSEGRFFITVLMEHRLEKEPWEFNEEIQLVSHEGEVLPAGQYRLNARLVASGASREGVLPLENSLEFRIE